ncbi:MAG: response regulator [Deltaproteobacteria bacterium]|nr:response regulator [Deltaproteobacteria bacterium]
MPRILIVDDEEMIQRLLKRFLEDRGHEVYTVSTGQEALEMMKRAPEIILLDMMLPDMDGLEVFNRAKEIRPSARVILMSGMHRENDSLARFDGDIEFIPKPLNLEHLAQVIDSEIGSKSPCTVPS